MIFEYIPFKIRRTDKKKIKIKKPQNQTSIIQGVLNAMCQDEETASAGTTEKSQTDVICN